MLPHLTNRTPWFAFLLHFRDMEDIDRLRCSSLVRRYSHSEADFKRKMSSLPPLVGAEVNFGFGSAIRGEVIGVMRLPEDMLGPQAMQFTLEAVELALQRGTRVIGLGALTAPATGGGLKLLRHIPAGVTLTNGNAYTAAVVRRNVIEASDALGLGRQARVAIVGCTGSVGACASLLLAESGYDLILIGRSTQRVHHQLGELANQAVCTGDLGAAREADIVVLVTSDPSARLTPEHVRAGAVVIDVAQPPNIIPSAYGGFRSANVTVVEGAIVRIPGYGCSTDLGLPDPGDTFACLTETYLFAREGIREHSVGRASVDLARRLERLAQRHGIYPRPLDLRRSEESVSDELEPAIPIASVGTVTEPMMSSGQ